MSMTFCYNLLNGQKQLPSVQKSDDLSLWHLSFSHTSVCKRINLSFHTADTLFNAPLDWQ